jgi:hypothetical protein
MVTLLVPLSVMRVLINPPPVGVRTFVEKKDREMEELYAEFHLPVREVAKLVRVLRVTEERGGMRKRE